MNYLGDFTYGATIYVPFNTYDGNGASVTLTGLAVTDIEIYKNGSVTQRASDAGYALLDTDGIDFDGITGIHGFSIDTADNTTAGFFGPGNEYFLVVSAVTVSAQTVNFVYSFSLENRAAPTLLVRTTIATLSSQTSFTLTAGSADNDAYNGCVIVVQDAGSAVQKAVGVILDYTGSTKTVTLLADPAIFTMAATDYVAIYADRALKATVDNRTLDVSATGEGGVDWGNVGSPTTTVGLSGTTVKTATDVETDTQDIQGRTPAALVSGRMDASVGAMAANVMTAAAAAADLTTELQFGLATAAALDAVDNFLDTEVADIQARLPAALTAGGNMKADALAISGDTVAADNAEAFFDGTGYAGSNNVIPTVTAVGTLTTYTGNTPQTGDSFARIGANGAGLSNVPWNASWDAEVQSECDDALVAQNLDHLVKIAVDTNFATTVHADSVVGQLADNGAGFDRTTDSLEAIRDRGDAAWITGAGGGDGSTLTAIPWNASWDAEIQSEVQDAIVVNGLDHLVAASVAGTDIVDDSIVAKLASKSATADWDSYVNTTDALEALRDRGDTAWVTATSVTVSDKTGFKLASDGIALVTAWTVNLTGNLSGSVGSVTGAVGSVGTGGIVAASFAAGAIDAAAIAVNAIGASELAADAVAEIQSGIATAASIAALNNLSASQVNAEVVDALTVDTYAEPGQGAPAATLSIAGKINWNYKFLRNKHTQSATEFKVFADDGTTVDHKAAVSDDGTTFTRAEITAGP